MPSDGLWSFDVQAGYPVDLYLLDACDPAGHNAARLSPDAKRPLREGELITLLVSPSQMGVTGPFAVSAQPAAAGGCNLVGELFAFAQVDANQRIFVDGALDAMLPPPGQQTCGDAAGGQLTYRVSAPAGFPQRLRFILEAPFGAVLDAREACGDALGGGRCVGTGQPLELDFAQTPELLLSVTSIMPVSGEFRIYIEPF